MQCSDVQNKLSAYYDGELSVDLKAEVAQHVDGCDTCAAELREFERLTEAFTDLTQLEVPQTIWDALLADLTDSPDSMPGHGARVSVEQPHRTAKTSPKLALAASVLLLLSVGYWMTRESGREAGHREHSAKFVDAMDHYLRQLPVDAKDAEQFLLNKYHGQIVNAEEAITIVGYRPAVADGLPSGYSLDSTCVLKMPCCTCVKAVCRRQDGSTLVLFEHDDEKVEWFGDRPTSMAMCGDKECCLVDLDSSIAATWERGSRSITAVGLSDAEEINRFVAWLDENREIAL